MLNRVILIGRTTADPDVQYTQSGIARARFRLAVDRGYRTQQGERQTDFINVVCWRRQAEVIGEYLKKGRLVAVEGRLQVRNYKTPDGENRTMYEVVADSVRFLESRAAAQASAPSSGEAPERTADLEEAPEEELGAEPSDEGPADQPEGEDLPF